MCSEVMYVIRGVVAVGFSRLNTQRIGESPFHYPYCKKGKQTLLDYQVFQHQLSDFIYRVREDLEGYSLDQETWHLLDNKPKFQESTMELKRLSFINYRQGIYKKVNFWRREHI